MKVLLVDDSKTMRNIERGVLAQMGHTDVVEAGDGAEAMSLLPACQPDLVLLDWNMPQMDGLSFVKRYRAGGGLARVIMVTAEAERERVVEAIRAGVNNYVVKPFTPDLLAQRITDTLNRRTAA